MADKAQSNKPANKRTVKTPIEAAKANVALAIAQLESLGGRLFKLDKGGLTAALQAILTSTRELAGKL